MPDARTVVAGTAQIIDLAAGRVRASVAPEVGGTLARLAFEAAPGRWFEILRPTSSEALQTRNARESASFPMVPFASLVDRGAFSFSGTAYRLRLNLPPHEAAMHGDAWQHPWRTVGCTTNVARLVYRQDGKHFPFAYEACQEIRVEPDALVISLAITNTGREAMPAGLGFHPFFSLTPDVTLQFDAAGRWVRDERGRVTVLEGFSSGDSFARPTRIAGIFRNDVYEDWSGKARVEWPDARIVAELTAEAPLSRLLVFVPEHRPVFCVEPISNLPDGFNLLDAGRVDAGISILKPDETLTGRMRLRLGTT